MAVVVSHHLVYYIDRLLFGQTTYVPWFVDLFTNVLVPNCLTDLSAYDICDLPGYSTFALNGNSWSIVGQPNECIAEYQYPQITYNFDAYAGGVTIFGYVVSDGTNVLYSELFPAPYPIPPAGGELPLVLLFTAEQCPA
jgi:hypothetical protein